MGSDTCSGTEADTGPAAAAGVVLAGGRSSRMGSSKALLEWHGSTLLHRTAAVLARVVDGPVVVVRAPGQALPPLPPGVGTTEDPVAGLGPMQGIAAGLAAVAGHADSAFVCSTDLPLLHPAFVTRLLTLLREADVDVVMPVVGGHRQPLAAAYRTGLAPLITALLAEGDLRPKMLLRHCSVALPEEAELRADGELARLDPELTSVRGVNTPEEYAEARRRPGPTVSVELAGGVHAADAATLGAAAEAVGLQLDPAVLTTINGRPVPSDPRVPLVAGDRIGFQRSRHSASPSGDPGRSGHRVG